MKTPGHCTPRALPQDDYVILQGASSKGVAISFFPTNHEIASVVLLPRNDSMIQWVRGECSGRES